MFNEAVLADILKDSQARVVILSASWANPFEESADGVAYARAGDNAPSPQDNATNLDLGLRGLVGKLTAAGKQVVIIEDTPLFDFDPMRLRLADLIPLRRRLAGLVSVDPQIMPGLAAEAHIVNAGAPSADIVRKVAVALPGIRPIEPFSILCGEAGCRFAGGDTLYYYDEQHLSAAGAAHVLEGFDLSRR
jgi:hypothetical protein